ncbi:MAG: phosphoribosyl-AMP cyclohydrolase [Chloroflexi bacterium HGW-Chloroflexi-1]|nr:MAG: phosphoribosyl-AMP cyclohydrolase [Chloroflexi bacterium HGW-Chloroflexi-1]
MKGIHDVAWDASGHAPVIVQDTGTGAVLALAYMDRAALATTLSTGWATYHSPPGTGAGCAATGPLQMITAVRLGCDGRTILLQVQPAGPLCQTEADTCFAAALSAEAAPPDPTRMSSPTEPFDISIAWSSEAAEGA